MSRHYCTYFDHGFTARAVAMFRSLRQQDPDCRLHALCFDDAAYARLSDAPPAGLEPIRLADFLAAEPELAAVRPSRSTVEFYFTCTPALPLFVFARHPEVELVTYVDADLWFFGPVEPLYGALGEGSVSIIPHRFAPALAEMIRNGKYNVAWLSFRRDDHALACLHWWRERCLEWCYDRHEPDRYADQKYLDLWPELFAGVREIDHPGANLAPWNLARHRLEPADDASLLVDGRPLLFYHFHGLKKLAPGLYDSHLGGYRTPLTPLLRDRVYRPYIRALEACADFGPIQYQGRGRPLARTARRLLRALGWGRAQLIRLP